MFLNSMQYLNLTTEFQLLRFVHALWTDEAEFFLRKELREAKRMNSCEQDFSILGAELKCREENELGKWLQQIRESGYAHCLLYSLYSIGYASFHLCVCVGYYTDKCCYKKVEFINCKFCSEIDIVIE